MEIGGYFELELHNGEHYHKGALCLNSARSCFEYVLRARNYRKVYVPYFTCEIVMQPLRLLHIDYEYYTINAQLEPVTLPDLKKDEAFLYTNYFALKQSFIEYLAKHYGNQLIIDNAQAFYAKPIIGTDTFYSARKFFGVPDGAYLYSEKRLNQEFVQDVSFERMGHLLKRIDLGAEAGYGDFKHNDDALAEQPIMWMSVLTERLLKSIDYQSITRIRRENFQLLETELGKYNKLELNLSNNAVPLVYPFISEDANLKRKLIENKVFVATYWPNVMEWCRKNDWEYQLTQQTCFLPVDQRYGKEDMERIVDLILR